MSRLYDDVEKAIPASGTRPLTNTRDLVAKLQANDAAAASKVNAPAIDMVMDAITRPEGLTFQVMHKLRSSVGAMMNGALLPQG